MSHQQTKYLIEATTSTGKDIMIDFMQIDMYEVIDDDPEKPLIQIAMRSGDTRIIEGDMTKMKAVGSQIGIPIHPFTTRPSAH